MFVIFSTKNNSHNQYAGVSLSFCAGGQWGFSAGNFLFLLWKKVRREDENSRANWWPSLIHSQSISAVNKGR